MMDQITIPKIRRTKRRMKIGNTTYCVKEEMISYLFKSKVRNEMEAGPLHLEGMQSNPSKIASSLWIPPPINAHVEERHGKLSKKLGKKLDVMGTSRAQTE